MRERTVPSEKNQYRTSQCAHGPSDVCNYCLVAHDWHLVGKNFVLFVPRKGDRPMWGHEHDGVYFQCAACTRETP
jgi:hypothetical protein